MAKLCMGCMNPLPEGSTVCSVCGFDPATNQNPAHCLPITASLQGHYIVGRLMSEASDHLLYLAYDRQLREPCFIQEFFPAGLSRRDTIGGVQPLEGCDQPFEEYAAQFRTMMRSLARMRELPAIVPVYDIFEENGTVYAVSDYCQGMTLTKKTKLSAGRIPWQKARPLFMSLLSGISALNEAGIHHLAISPDNILIGSDGKARLRGFSIPATHQQGGNLKSDLRSGYAAPEQYAPTAELGAAADVYGIAATLFRTVTGNEPPAGNARAKNSDDLFMSVEVAEELTQPVCVALFNALQVQAANRTDSVAKLRDQLSVTPTVSALMDEVEEDIVRKDAAKKEKKKGGKLLWVFLGCFLFFALAALAVLYALGLLDGIGGDKDISAPTTTVATEPSRTITTRPTLGTDKVSVEKVVDQNYYTQRDKPLKGSLYLVVDSFKFSDEPAGTILSQEPAAGEVVVTGSPIKVVISCGRESEAIVVPNLRGWQKKHAELYLEALGFRVESITVTSSTLEKGLVDGTDPAAGFEMRMGETVTLRVSDVEKAESTTSTTQPTESTEPTESTDPTESTEPTESTDPTDPTDPTGTEGEE